MTSSQRSINGCKKLERTSPRTLEVISAIGFRKNRFDPFGYFYLTIEIHKTPVSTRPVCSDCASLVHPLGKWLNYALQPIVAESSPTNPSTSKTHSH